MSSRTTAKAKTVASKPAAKPAPKPAPEPTPVQDKVQDNHSAMTTQSIKDDAQATPDAPAPDFIQDSTQDLNTPDAPAPDFAQDSTQTPSQSEQTTTTRTTQKGSGRMTAVRFLRGYGVYNVGEIAAFKQPEADKLIALGHAEEL